MSTPSQTLANQHNAKLSTGPSTPAGQSASSRNAFNHGLSNASFALLPQEDPAAFQCHLENYSRKFAPQDDHEEFLVLRMVESRWKLARIQRMEVALLQQLAHDPESPNGPDAAIAAAMLKGGANAYASLQRYSAAAERSYYKALRELESNRSPATAPSPAPVRPPAPKPAVPNEANPAPAPRDITFSGKPATVGNLALRL